ncbi:putative odorant receptor 92a [Galleria mellonella]|uniref:Odorant receptor n=1 Tax=Galleria mellonella TaxID=7137 RepID=A0ABM3N3W9_GALME|nr:putative odorant receptor 92a [Galleria mellonella]
MEQESQEKMLFQKYLDRTNKFLNITGMYLKEEDSNRSLIQRLRHRWFYCFNSICFNTAIIGQIGWYIEAIMTDKSITEITYFMPCVTLCFLGNLKAFYFVKYAHYVNGVVDNLKKLQNLSSEKQKYRDDVEEEMLKNGLRIYNMFTYMLVCTNGCGLLSFIIGPLLTMAVYYYTTSKIVYLVPFFIWYPNEKYVNYAFRRQFREIIQRHKILIDCVNLLEIIYTKSTLFNVATSSLIICVTGFNITTIDNIIVMMPFISFLLMALLQIVVLCYYGDKIMEYSLEVSNAVYRSQWYMADAAVMKDLLFLSLRTQRACKLTAYEFTDINLNTYARIIGRAWSYFALLQTVYGRKGAKNH